MLRADIFSKLNPDKIDPPQEWDPGPKISNRFSIGGQVGEVMLLASGENSNFEG
jgi:hypothetical protein